MLIKKTQTERKENDKACTVWEYDFKSKKIGLAVALINGRHPEQGRIINKKCNIVYYVISGKGKVFVDNTEYIIDPGDSLYIVKGKDYFIEGEELFIALPTAPAWSLGQLKLIE